MATPIDNHWLVRAREVAADVLGRHAGDVDRQARWPAESVEALAQSGLLGLTIEGALGGAGEGPGMFAGVTRELAEQCASTAMIFVMHVCGAQTIAAAEGFAQRETVMRQAAAGKRLCTLAFSERGSRSHFWQPVSQATVEGDVYRLTADKSWVTSAGHADSYIVSTRSVGREEPLATTIYHVERETPGLSVGAPFDGMGLRGNASSPMCLTDVALRDADRLCDEGQGFSTMLNTVLPWFQLGSAAVWLGVARAATRGTRQHLLAGRFEHLGQPLASLLNLRARLARMQALVDVQEAFLGHVVARMEQPGPDTMLAVLESKAAAAEMALEVTDLAMRACGGAAFSRHLSVERNFRDARAGSVMAPTTDVLYDLIAKSLLEMPLF
ncbi:MAG TPA: acyl-CoA dehydrogenase family protein [Pirellulales bacterium]|jgi:alkylation response protein AidB-like acyl-CoA dehydrogenase|nr:acyl-CoA dehydrogenase family protein [Pirellulales bacterium]